MGAESKIHQSATASIVGRRIVDSAAAIIRRIEFDRSAVGKRATEAKSVSATHTNAIASGSDGLDEIRIGSITVVSIERLECSGGLYGWCESCESEHGQGLGMHCC